MNISKQKVRTKSQPMMPLLGPKSHAMRQKRFNADEIGLKYSKTNSSKPDLLEVSSIESPVQRKLIRFLNTFIDNRKKLLNDLRKAIRQRDFLKK